ncbi:hypothetical protein [Sulfuricurvum sp.]|uniref:hypothetical protein n=1 Tax=Sulfuricurvum sp. TaxID=2025608 RepID=UPI0035642A39
MIEENFTVSLTCLFCDVGLEGDTCVEYKSGDLIKCQNCDAENDYGSLIEIAKSKGIEKVKLDIENELKNIFKKFK